ncbi:MAG: sugar ABC transporter ATP-binding protein [Clostridiales Family XIII bacterium]|nr:sugar ABC transporter ATP-binding protein [Clostridiales Family XIII bacterium]
MQIQNITKTYPGVVALDDVSFDIERGSVHCLLGENGAGKSTLIKILTGAQIRTSGAILMNGAPIEAKNTKEAREIGISTLFQELNVVDQLTVEENLSLGMEPTRFGFFRKNPDIGRMLQTLARLEPSIDAKQLVSKLSVAKKQIVEIVKAVETKAEVIIMDEPTAAISEGEVKRLFEIIAGLKEHGVTVIYISHRLDEIFEIGDYVTVLRDGRHEGTKKIAEIEGREELIRMILGKTVVETYRPREVQKTEKYIEAQHITNGKLKDVSFDVYKGEIVGFYGLIGSGKTELSNVLYGIDAYEGALRIKGREARFKSVAEAVAQGITLAPEERRSQGLFTMLSIRKNIISMNMKKISRSGIINAALIRSVSGEFVEKLNVVTDTDEKEVGFLSGGNQQKVVFAKCLNSEADIFLLDEPTRGVDVGAKEEIHGIIRQLADEGRTCIVFSSELPEVLACCDRIFLLHEGALKAVMDNAPDIDSDEIIHIVAGGGEA